MSLQSFLSVVPPSDLPVLPNQSGGRGQKSWLFFNLFCFLLFLILPHTSTSVESSDKYVPHSPDEPKKQDERGRDEGVCVRYGRTKEGVRCSWAPSPPLPLATPGNWDGAEDIPKIMLSNGMCRRREDTESKAPNKKEPTPHSSWVARPILDGSLARHRSPLSRMCGASFRSVLCCTLLVCQLDPLNSLVGTFRCPPGRPQCKLPQEDDRLMFDHPGVDSSRTRRRKLKNQTRLEVQRNRAGERLPFPPPRARDGSAVPVCRVRPSVTALSEGRQHVVYAAM